MLGEDRKQYSPFADAMSDAIVASVAARNAVETMI